MHLTDVSVGALGSFAIVGAHLPITVGAALASSYRADGAVHVAFFGDGATNIGAFHEALNLAAVWNLPALFICENNLYGEYSPLRVTTPVDSLAERVGAYGLAGTVVDGNDLAEVHRVVSAATDRARTGAGPAFIEALTYRHYGHSRSDPATYRPAGELDAWLTRDPITRLRRQLVQSGHLSEAAADAVERDARDGVTEAAKRASAWPDPEPGSRFEDIWMTQ
jgi:pyruvate dehydrogenase E1 component alpha subunit